MGIKDLFNRRKEGILVEENTQETDSTSQVPSKPVERIRREIYIPDKAIEQWSTAIFDSEIQDAIREFDWTNPKLEELTLLIRNSTNCIRALNKERVKISFIKYLASIILNQYCMANNISECSEYKRNEILKSFMMTLIQAIADVCTIFGIDFYAMFLAIKNMPVYHERKNGKTIEYLFKYSFRYFSKLWENSKSKFLLDNREDHIRVYDDVMSSFFEEFLENAEPVDIDAMYKFSIQNEEFIETDYSELLSEAISDGYYEPKVYIQKGVAMAISRCYPDLLVNSYINRFNSIVYDMQEAKYEGNEERITNIDNEMQELIRVLSDYQEYRSEDFTAYFKTSWDWFLGAVVACFSGVTLTVFSDYLINTIKIPHEDIEEYIVSNVICLFLDLASIEEIPLNPITFAESYRLLSNEVAYEVIAMMNPNLVNSF